MHHADLMLDVPLCLRIVEALKRIGFQALYAFLLNVELWTLLVEEVGPLVAIVDGRGGNWCCAVVGENCFGLAAS